MAVTRILTDGVANTAISRIDGDLTLVGAAANVLWDKSADDLIFADNAGAVFGTGNDLKIYHDGSSSYVSDGGTGSLYLRGTNIIMDSATGEKYIDLVADGAVTLYYDNSAKLATASGGISVTGTYTGTGLMTTGGNIVIPNAGNIGSASDTDAIAIASNGVVTMNQIPVFSAGINVSGGTIAGTLSTAAQGSVTSLGTLTALTTASLSVSSTGNVIPSIITASGNAVGLAIHQSGATRWELGAGVGDGSGNFNLYSSLSGTSGIRLAVTNAGLVGIGTTSPAKVLHVKGGNDSSMALDNGGEQYTSMTVLNNGTQKGALYFDNTNGLFSLNAFTSLPLTLGAANAEKIRVTTNGDTGIGTTAPGNTLEVFTGNSTKGIRINRYGSGTYYSDIIHTDTPERLAFKVGTGSAIAEIMAIHGGGTVGIGATSTTARLNVKAAADNNYQLLLQQSNGADGFGLICDMTDGDLAFSRYGSSTFYERMRIRQGGDVCINTVYSGLFNQAGGNAKLTVVGESSSTSVIGNIDAAITIANKDGTAGNTTGLHFARADTDETPNYAGASIVAQFGAAQVTGQYPAADLNFCTSTSQAAAPSLKMTLTDDGSLGIGVTAPPEKLTVKGDIKVDLDSYIGSTPADSTAIAITSSGGSQIQFYRSGGDDGIKFYTHDSGTRHTESARMDQFGNLQIGTAGQGPVAAGAMSISATGMGIASPASVSLQYYMIKATQVEAHIGFKSGTDQNWYLGTAHGLAGVGSAGVYQTNTGAGWTNVSDENYKKALQPITNALDKIKDCRGMTGLYKTDPDDRHRRSFLIAQDWVPVLPEAVDQNTTDDDDVTPKLGMQYDATIPLLVEAIKELRTQNIAYAARIAALEG